ncbi:MAG: YoaK family protein [Verrucomicrobium sp.]|nr:YoaK family protein [Verrucomicrobium sp.]
MQPLPRRLSTDFLILSAAGGAADAAGFFGLDHVFTSNMTGNVVLFGLALGQTKWTEAFEAFEVIAFFMLGAFIGAWLAKKIDRHDWPRLVRRVLLPQIVLMTLFSVACMWEHWEVEHLASLLAVAMGLQASAINRAKMPGVVTTAVTGTITTMSNGLMEFFMKVPGAPHGQQIAFQFGAVCCFCLGALGSGLLTLYYATWVGWFPTVLIALVILRNLNNEPEKRD